jgi:hypothetical protein
MEGDQLRQLMGVPPRKIEESPENTPLPPGMQ